MTLDVNQLLDIARNTECSDLHFTMDLPPVVRQHGILKRLEDFPVCNDELLSEVVRQLCTPEQVAATLEKGQDCDTSFTTDKGFRNRVNVYYQKGHLAVAIRLLRATIPTFEELGLPSVLGDFAMKPRGLVLVTGPTGSGKSTTLAAMINHINTHKSCHIIIVEDPIEYVHKHGMSMINQREIGSDVVDFATSLRSALREDPDVILIGEMRDYETMQAAITAAETGHLVMSTVHTTDAASTINRIIDVFPPHQQQEIRTQLASVLVGICSQQLVPTMDGRGRVAALEILAATDAVAAMIREDKVHQIHNAIQTGKMYGMVLRDQSLANFVKQGKISKEEARSRVSSIEDFIRFLDSKEDMGW